LCSASQIRDFDLVFLSAAARDLLPSIHWITQHVVLAKKNKKGFEVKNTHGLFG